MNGTFATAVITCVAIALFAQVIVSRRRQRRDVREYLAPPLRERSAEFISAVSPKGLFNTGPFPKFEAEVGRPISSIAGVQGEYLEYKIVHFRDSEGAVPELWALIEFEVFKFRRVRWRAEYKEGLSPAILSMLEN